MRTCERDERAELPRLETPREGPADLEEYDPLRGDRPWFGRPLTVVGRADGLFLEDVILEAEEADLCLEFDAITPPYFFSCHLN